MIPFLRKLALFLTIGLVPVLLLLVGYIYFDPFKVIRSYDNYSYPYVVPNRDFISTEVFLHKDARNQYNAFILGSSRTLGFRPDHWKKYLPADARPFMFDASAETIYGIYTKLRLMDSLNVPLENVLLVLCRDMTFKTDRNSEGLLYIKHPATSGESRIAFQSEFFKAYLSPKFLFCFYTYELTNKYYPFMRGYIESRRITYDTVSNEISIIDQEEEIQHHPDQYYAARKAQFVPRTAPSVDSVQQISAHMVEMLHGIRAIFDRRGTNYKIVLSPLYERKQFNPADRDKLEKIFPGHVYDFTGDNPYTRTMENYYEKNHFRPVVGDGILATIYH